MRLLKVIVVVLLAATAVTVGVVAVVALALGMTAYFLGRQLVRRLGVGASGKTSPPRSSPHVARHDGSDVIEVTATEVPSERLPQ